MLQLLDKAVNIWRNFYSKTRKTNVAGDQNQFNETVVKLLKSDITFAKTDSRQ